MPSPVHKLSNEQLICAKKAFFDMDRDFSGFIDREELTMMMRALGQNPSDDEIGEMIAEAEGGSDGDGDGKINLREFLKWYATQLQKSNDTTTDDVKDTFKALGGTAEEGMPKDALKNMLLADFDLEIDVDDVFGSTQGTHLSQTEFEAMMLPDAQTEN